MPTNGFLFALGIDQWFLGTKPWQFTFRFPPPEKTPRTLPRIRVWSGRLLGVCFGGGKLKGNCNLALKGYPMIGSQRWTASTRSWKIMFPVPMDGAVCITLWRFPNNHAQANQQPRCLEIRLWPMSLCHFSTGILKPMPIEIAKSSQLAMQTCNSLVWWYSKPSDGNKLVSIPWTLNYSAI